MNRRDALKKAALLLGGTLSASTLLAINQFVGTDKLSLAEAFDFTKTESQILAEIAEMIIPKTQTPGAKEAGVPAFIELMIQDCYRQAEQSSFRTGLAQLEKIGFLNQSLPERKTTLKNLEAETKELLKSGTKVTPFWRLVKDLTLLGYYTSEVGIKASFIYEPIPTKLENIKIKPDQKAFIY
jgi:hypothetical protein